MFSSSTRLAIAALLGVAISAPAGAESFASSASSAGSASSASASDSLGDSSRGSSPDRQAINGDYRVIDVAELGAGVLRLTLQATQNEGHQFTLKLPREALGRRGIAVGDMVNARNRPYGLEFARLNDERTREAFFLVLADDWQKELEPRAVTL